MNLVYLGGLLVSLAGLTTLDRRFRLVFFNNSRLAFIALGLTYVLLIAWDFCGIAAGVFFKGSSPYISGFDLAPNFPVEEVLFLGVLCYSAAMIIAGFGRRR